MITLNHFSIGYHRRELIKDSSTVFPPTTLTALIGRNGTGKSTLLRAIAGLYSKYSGEIMIDGKNRTTLKPGELARLLSFVNTERTRIPNLRCKDVVALGRAPYTDWIGRINQKDEDIIRNSLASIGMEDYAEKTMDKMSDGECQRIMIARALAQDTPNILLDEPTSFLDLPNRYKLVGLLHRLAHEQNKCIIFSTHELDIALKLADRIVLIADQTMYNLTSSEMSESELIQDKFGISIS